MIVAVVVSSTKQKTAIIFLFIAVAPDVQKILIGRWWCTKLKRNEDGSPEILHSRFSS